MEITNGVSCGMMCLFLLGLLTGFAELAILNIRMGLAAHLEGVMNGILLLPRLGAVWSNVGCRPSPPQSRSGPYSTAPTITAGS